MRQDAKTTVIDHVAEFHAERARLAYATVDGPRLKYTLA